MELLLRASEAEPYLEQSASSGGVQPSAKAIYQQRKKYGKIVAAMGEVSQYKVEHLTTFTMDRKESILTVEDSVRKLQLLDARGKVWTQEIYLNVDDKCLKLSDCDSSDELENFPLTSIVHIQPVINACNFNSICAIVVKDTEQHSTDIHLFQCSSVPADIICADVSSAMSHLKSKKGEKSRPETLRRHREAIAATYAPPSTPPINVKDRVAERTTTIEAQKKIPQGNCGCPSSYETTRERAETDKSNPRSCSSVISLIKSQLVFNFAELECSSSEDGRRKKKKEKVTGKRKRFGLNEMAKTEKSVKRKKTLAGPVENARRDIKCCMCKKEIVSNIAQHFIKAHKIANPQERRRLCTLSRLNEEKKKTLNQCPICDKSVGRVSQHLQRYHKLDSKSTDYRRAMGKGSSEDTVIHDFKVFMEGSSGGGNKDTSILKVLRDVTNIFRSANGVTFDAGILEPIVIDKDLRDNTIYNHINSVKHFLRFAQQNEDLFPLEAPKLAQLQISIKNWAKTYKKKSEARSMLINSSSHEGLLNSKEKTKYLRSPFAMSCERTLRGEAQSSASVLSRGDILGHLMLRLQLHNAQRPKAIAGLRWEDFDSASHQGQCHIVKSHDHKTAEALGSASLAFPDELHALVAALRKEMPIDGEFIFSTSGRALSTSSATKFMQLAWAKGGLKSRFSSTLWRKSVVTAVHDQRPEMANQLARHMSHSVQTARRTYNCTNASSNAEVVTSEINKLTF